MKCEKCGEVCQCPMEPPPIDPPPPDLSPIVQGNSLLARGAAGTGPGSDSWRNELVARLSHYRARRKAPPPRYPSLRLPFGPAVSALEVPPLEDPVSAPQMDQADHSVVLDDALVALPGTDAREPEPVRESRPQVRRATSGAKIIEFPRFAWAPPPPPLDQLAGPVGDVPRILEVPEVAPQAPALGGITIEPVAVEENRKHPGIDTPLQNAPLGRRFLASLIDDLIIGSASALFGFVFWKVALVRPPQIQLWILAAGIPCLFWAAYQYLLLVYSGSTPGLRLASLQLSRFDGKPTTRSLRRWRVFASYLSAASLAMGYVWLFLDEDALCWHDRITHTYLAPRKQTSNNSR